MINIGVLTKCLQLVLGLLLGAFLEAKPPNILLILADDMGYGDVGVNDCQDIPTPHLDALAASGINFTAGYVTHPYCSPSRAAIMSGRHQSRIGHDCNPQESHNDPTQGIIPSAKLLPARLKEVGYKTALVGKWHLGHASEFQPRNRGFDYFFGFLSGGYSYWGHPSKKKNDPIYEDGRIVSPKEITYMTTDLGKKTIAFMERNKEKPWFCFLSYNAPHAPDQAPKEAIAKFESIIDHKRKLYAAMVSVLDDSVGEIMAALENNGQRDNTIVYFLSDNGGRHPSANNGIYRGHKGRTYEGGIRVPFMVSWPGTIPAGKTYTHPVSSLDLYATSIALAGAKDKRADGIDLLPILENPEEKIPERPLFYRISGGWGYAVADPQYKLVKTGWSDQKELYDLVADPKESKDVSENHPEVLKKLSDYYKDWNKSNIDPLWSDPHKENVAKEMRGESIN